MLSVGQLAPAKEIRRSFLNIRNNLEQHDGFVEMIKVVGGEAGAGVDIGGPQPGRPRVIVAANLAWCRAIRWWGFGSR